MPFVMLPDKFIPATPLSGWRFHRLLRAPVGATKVGEEAGLATRYYKRWVFRGRLTDGPKGWNRQPPAARRTGSQVAFRPNDPPRRGYGRSDCPSLWSRRIVAASRPSVLVPVFRRRDGYGLAFLRYHDKRHRRIEARAGTVGAGTRDPCLWRTREVFAANAA